MVFNLARIFKRRDMLWFYVAAGVYVAMSAALLFAKYRQREYRNWVAHTYEVIDQINEIDVLLNQAESSESSYFLQHSDNNLRAYFSSTEMIPDGIETLETLVVDNPLQVRRVKELHEMLTKRMDTMATLLGRARAGQNDHLVQALDLQSSLKIRQQLAGMEAAERILLKQREDRTEGNLRLINSALLLSTLVAFAMISIGLLLSRRSLREKHNQNRFLSSVFDCMSGGLLVSDLHGSTTYFNRAAQDLVGVDMMNMTSEERLRRAIFLNAETGLPIKKEESSITRALKGEEVNNFEVRINHAVRGERTLRLDARPIYSVDNVITSAIVLIQDVTEAKDIEKHAHEARESALEASRLKSDFLANMSHEIRTPMNGVLGMATLLLDTAMTTEQQAHVKTIKNSADSLLSLINQILDHSKIEAGKLELESADFNLHESLESVMSMFRYLSRSKNLELKLAMDPATPEFMRGDQARFRQILINLVGNAMKFTEKGFVEISVQPILCSNSVHKILVEIKDSGMGIPKAAQKDLFGRFAQTKQTKFSRGSTGLGLMISRELVSLMKGDIGFESIEGFGTRFWFTAEFGLAEKVVHEPLNKAHVRKTFVGHVLVAEDQPVNQAVVRKFLELFGVTCDVVENGQLALDAFKRSKYDLVFMDCQMPVMDGYDATTAMRAFEKTLSERGRTAIVALTAEGRSGDRKLCYEVGMDDFLTKPIEIDRLQTVLEERLAKRARSRFKPSALEKLEGFESKGKPLAEVLIFDYIESTPAILRSMAQAEKDQDYDQLSTFAHALRSTSLTLGLETVGELCDAIENNPKTPSQVLPLREAWSEGCTQLQAFLNSRNRQVA